MTNQDTTPAAVEELAMIFETYDGDVADMLRALSAQLEAANQRAEMLANSLAKAHAAGKAEGLRQAALRVVSRKDGSVLHSPSPDLSEAHDAILALIPADTPAPTKVPISFPTGWRERCGGMGLKQQKIWADGFNACRAIAGGRDE
jgi:hypothetical protein